MAMFRCGGGKPKTITVSVTGKDNSYGGSGMTRVSATGSVIFPNLGWTKVICDSNSNTVGGSSTVVSRVNNVNISVGEPRDITGVEIITLQVASNMTGSGLSGHDTVNATFTLS